MKGTLFCKVFGHKFIRKVSQTRYIPEENDYGTTIYFPILRECIHCGLSKEELGMIPKGEDR